MSRRRPLRRRHFGDFGDGPIPIRVGSRRSPRKFVEVLVSGRQDTGRFARLVEDQTRAFPRDPIIISVPGYQPWLEDVLSSCIEDSWSDISDLDREVQFAGTMQFPEKNSYRGKEDSWTFILDQMNVPQVYYWSVGMDAPPADDYGLPSIDLFRFRTGVWLMGRGACAFNRNAPVVFIFTKPDRLSELVVSELMFDYLYKDQNFNQPPEDEEGICWIFSRLYWLLTDWQNIITEITIRLDEAEGNSHGRHLPVKLRARIMHNEIDRLFEMQEFLRFHSRALKKLQKLKDDVPKNEQKDPLWTDIDDSVEDLEQFGESIDGLKERFTNLIDLEFNIQNAVQADNGQFLSMVATLFLPASFVASLFGMSTVTWPPIWYLYIALPVFVISAVFTAFYRWAQRRIQKWLYPAEQLRIPLQPNKVTMLGDELPASVNIPGLKPAGRPRRKSTRPAGMDDENTTRARSKSRRQGEKDELDD